MLIFSGSKNSMISLIFKRGNVDPRLIHMPESTGYADCPGNFDTPRWIGCAPSPRSSGVPD